MEILEQHPNITRLFLGTALIVANIFFYFRFDNAKKLSNQLYVAISKVNTNSMAKDRKLTFKYFFHKIEIYNHLINFFSKFYGVVGLFTGIFLMLSGNVSFSASMGNALTILFIQILVYLFAYVYLFRYKIKPCSQCV